jgi:hypothetical protein
VFPTVGVASIALSAIGDSNGGWAMLGIVLGGPSVVLPVVTLLAVAFLRGVEA